jgi:cell division protein FtsB
MPPSPAPASPSRRQSATEPLRRQRKAPAPAPAFLRKPVQVLLAFVTLVLLIDALVGDRGLVERLRAGERYRQAATELERLHQENAQLRDEVRRLNEDPSLIESLARKDLGLLRPGELLFIIKDVKPAN